MTEIQLDIPEELIRHYGILAIQERLQKQLDFEHMSLLAKEIHSEIEGVGLNQTSIFEEARAKAWENIKHRYFEDTK